VTAAPGVGAGPRIGRMLRFELTADTAAATDTSSTRIVVLDTAWTPLPTDQRESVRDAAAHVLSTRNLYDEAAGLLDDWAERSNIVELLTIDGTSFWFKIRLGYWWWLQEQLLWLGIVGALVAGEAPAKISCAKDMDPAAVGVLRLVAAVDGIVFEVDGGTDESGGEDAPAAEPPATVAAPEPRPPRRGVLGWFDRRRIRRIRRERERERERKARVKRIRNERTQAMLDRVDRLAGRRSLLVLMDHPRQQVETRKGRREVNPYLDPILDELEAAGVPHLEIESRSVIDDEAAWRRATRGGRSNVFFGGVLSNFLQPGEKESTSAEAQARADRIAGLDVTLVHDGIDFGPSLVERIADQTRRSFAARLREVVRNRRMLTRLQPLALLLINEYGRQEWLAAAREEGVPAVAVQHGGIQRRHPGYIHRDRPPELTLPDRTYVFGDWERRLLVESSVYHEDEVRVSGSPRLDLVRPEIRSDRNQVRRELRIAASNRMLVVSTTWGQLLRRFHFPVTLARLFDRELSNVHVVIKLHPWEPDDGLYRRVIEGVARAGGFAPPPISVVHRVDLYRLLAAADAHLGLYSTVITEAVFTETPNLLAACVRPSDLLGYVEAGVAVPVHDGGELDEALRSGAGRPDPAARDAFVRDHFEPGNASRKIRDDLLSWLRPSSAGERPA
jgi:hypothetical protein